VSAQPLSGAGTGRYLLLRTLLVFGKRGKPCPTEKLVEMRGNRGLSSQTVVGISARKIQQQENSQPQSSQSDFSLEKNRNETLLL